MHSRSSLEGDKVCGLMLAWWWCSQTSRSWEEASWSGMWWHSSVDSVWLVWSSRSIPPSLLFISSPGQSRQKETWLQHAADSKSSLSPAAALSILAQTSLVLICKRPQPRIQRHIKKLLLTASKNLGSLCIYLEGRRSRQSPDIWNET